MLKAYFDELVATGKSEETIKTYRVQLSRFISWLKENCETEDPREITSIDAIEYRDFLQEKGFKPASVNTALASIEALCTWMKSEGHIDHNPLEKVKRVEQVQEAPKWLDKREKYRVIRTVINSKNLRNKAIILTLLMAGLRVSELVNLKTDDVVISERKGSIVVQSGKGNKRRVVPVNKDLRDALSEYINEERATGHWLFPSQRGEKLTIRAVQHLCKEIGKKANLEQLTPHMLRHTFCHDLVSKGIDIGIVAKMAGHSKIDTTLIYTQPGEQELQAAVEKLSYT